MSSRRRTVLLRSTDRLAFHLLGYLVVLVAVHASMPLDGSLGTDDGAYGAQVHALEQGSWTLDRPLPVVSEANEGWFNARITPDGPRPYTSMPAYPMLLQASAALTRPLDPGGSNALGLQAVPIVGALAAAAAAWLVAGELDRSARVWAFWLLAAGPMLVTSTGLWAHPLSTATAGFAVLALLKLGSGPGPSSASTDQRIWLWRAVLTVALVAGAAIRIEAGLWTAALVAAATLWPFSHGDAAASRLGVGARPAAGRGGSAGELRPAGGRAAKAGELWPAAGRGGSADAARLAGRVWASGAWPGARALTVASGLAAVVWLASRAWGAALRADALPIATAGGAGGGVGDGAAGWLAGRLPAAWELLVTTVRPGVGPILLLVAGAMAAVAATIARASQPSTGSTPAPTGLGPESRATTGAPATLAALASAPASPSTSQTAPSLAPGELVGSGDETSVGGAGGERAFAGGAWGVGTLAPGELVGVGEETSVGGAGGEGAFAGRWHGWAVAVLLLGAALVTLGVSMVAPGQLLAGTVTAWPVVFVVLAAGGRRAGGGGDRPGDPAAVLLVSSLLFAGLVILTQYGTSGGLQWGGRYLSMAYVPVAAVAAARGRSLLACHRAPLLALLLAPTLVGVLAAHRLHTTNHAAVLAVTERPAEVVVTDVRPLTRIAWPALPTSFYRAGPNDVEALLVDLAEAGVETVNVYGLRAVDVDGVAGYQVVGGSTGIRHLERSPG